MAVRASFLDAKRLLHGDSKPVGIEDYSYSGYEMKFRYSGSDTLVWASRDERQCGLMAV